MAMDILTDAPPIRADADGAMRIGDSRVLLEIVIHAFQDGATAEEIVQRYPTTTLAEIYAVIAYYLRHPQVIERYLTEREQHSQIVRNQIDAHQDRLSEIRSRLLARKNA